MRDKFLLAFRSIRERKARSILTVLGIAVGIAAIVSLMSVGYGMEYAITGELTGMADMISVMPGKIMGGHTYIEMGGFTDRDVKDLQRISGIKDISAMTYDSVEVAYQDERKPTFVFGGDTKDLESFYVEPVGLKEGRWLRENDYKGCVIGDQVANDFFDDVIHVNDKLVLNGDKFVVVGVFEKGGMLYSNDVDRNIFLTLRAAKNVLQTDEIKYVVVRVYDIDEAEAIAEEIKEVINDNHGLDDFTMAMTMGSMLEQIGDIFNIIRGVLAGIAAIALIVASIGIMNTMLMSVMERTHEIGVMKAIGAKSRDVLALFLLESSIVSLVGGVTGCVVGVIVAKVLGFLGSAASGLEITAIVKPEVLLSGIAVAVIVGVLSGFYPARKASRMSPVEAVRYG
ncbi:putative ABC transport system permease protein [Methanophagales archaeon]|nr:putative ABC transport system permease protein [Methanophagales archaeon]